LKAPHTFPINEACTGSDPITIRSLSGRCPVGGVPFLPCSHACDVQERTQSMDIRILLVDDHKIVRDGLRTLIENEPGIMVVAEAENGENAVKLSRELHPDVVIMDISMPDMNGVEATRLIRQHNPLLKVIALSMYSHPLFVSGMLEAGASGYLLKDCAFEELVRAIRSVMDGRTWLSSKIAGMAVRRSSDGLQVSRTHDYGSLTAREREVFRLLAEGMSTRSVGKRLEISPKTVEAHRRNIMKKLNISSISELVKYAVREGVVSV